MRLFLLSFFVAIVAIAFVSGTPNAQSVLNEPVAKRNNCKSLYTQKQFRGAARKVYKSSTPVTPREKRQLRKFIRCQHSNRNERAVRKQLRGYQHAHRIIVQWHYYRTHPMPYCTWANESGKPWEHPQWPPSARYGIYNTTGSGARGKYQIMSRTWYANGGGSSWSPLNQERVARNLYAARGTQPWSGCH